MTNIWATGLACRHADVVFSGLASHTSLLHLLAPTFSHLRTRHLWQPYCVSQSYHSGRERKTTTT
jgi:hypothetical protein